MLYIHTKWITVISVQFTRKLFRQKQQVINRLRQACGATENIHKAESEKAQIETKLKKTGKDLLNPQSLELQHS